MSLEMAFLGPHGTFGHEAAMLSLPGGVYRPYPTHPAVLDAVVRGAMPRGIVAVENSAAGPVIAVQDHFIHVIDDQISVCEEVVLPINQCLFTSPGIYLADVQVVLSHPTGIDQCAENIRRVFPQAEIKTATSTGQAVRDMLTEDVPAAAIAGRAAAVDGAVIVQEHFEDMEGNSTRFWVVGKGSAHPTGCDKTSLAFELFENAPGALLAIMALFAARGLNLAKVESRPNRQALGGYVFLFDVEGHQHDEHLGAVLELMESCTSMLKVFGSYPQWRNGS